MDEDVVILDESLCSDERFCIFCLCSSYGASSSIGLYDHGIADKRGYEVLYGVPFCDEKCTWNMDSQSFDEEIDMILIHAESVRLERGVGISTPESLEKRGYLAIFPIHTMKYWDDEIILLIVLEEYIYLMG